MKNLLFVLSISLLVLLGSFDSRNKEEISKLRTFSEAEIKIILDNAVFIEPIAQSVDKKINIPDENKNNTRLITLTSQSFMVYVEVDKAGLLVRNPVKKNKASIITTQGPKPVVVTPFCVGYCPTGCTKSGCKPDGGHCSQIDCEGEKCSNNICTNYAIATGSAGIRIQ